MTQQFPPRRTGILVPLFSIPSERSWGIGEIGDLDRLTAWLAASGVRLLQLLPITEIPPHDTSPYGSLSAMAIDPQYITLDAMEDFREAGGEAALSHEQQAALARCRSAPAIDYPSVRAVKQAALRLSFAMFRAAGRAGESGRGASFRAFVEQQAWWLDDYALYRAISVDFSGRTWHEWPEPIRRRQPEALAEARARLREELLYRQYLQWIAAEQWAVARARARERGVALFGDLPFMVSGDSADVWSRQDEFDVNASVGVPPDAFSDTGQDWGLPPYRWDVLWGRDFDWLRRRARRMADLFDGCRVDHVVGFYRTFVRPAGGGEGRFTPADEASQTALGERVLEVLGSTGMEIVAEDLGTVPDFVRESLARLSIPGYKVFRWERYWNEPGQPFRDPRDYPDVAVATSGTHDTEPMTVWWTQTSPEERRAMLAIPSVRERIDDADASDALEHRDLSPTLRAALLEALCASPARWLILPIQDVYGWSDRINQPATVGSQNWTWRLPWPLERLSTEPEALAVMFQLLAWSRACGR
jgi:4-alpha-glucanotransferase